MFIEKKIELQIVYFRFKFLVVKFPNISYKDYCGSSFYPLRQIPVL